MGADDPEDDEHREPRRPRPERRQAPRRRAELPEPEPSINGALPAWLRAAVLLGVPSVIALFLVYMLTMAIAQRLTRIEQLIRGTCFLVAQTEEARTRCFE